MTDRKTGRRSRKAKAAGSSRTTCVLSGTGGDEKQKGQSLVTASIVAMKLAHPPWARRAPRPSLSVQRPARRAPRPSLSMQRSARRAPRPSLSVQRPASTNAGHVHPSRCNAQPDERRRSIPSRRNAQPDERCHVHPSRCNAQRLTLSASVHPFSMQRSARRAPRPSFSMQCALRLGRRASPSVEHAFRRGDGGPSSSNNARGSRRRRIATSDPTAEEGGCRERPP